MIHYYSKRLVGWLLGGLLLLLPALFLSCINDNPEDVVVLSFELDSAKLGKSDSLRFEIYNGKAPGPGDTTPPVQVFSVKTPKGSGKVDIKLSGKVESDFSVVVIAFDSTGAAQRKLFEFDDFNPDKDSPPVVLLAVITAVDLDMKPGEIKATALTLKPDDASDKRVTYSSSDTSVVKVVGANKDSLKAVADGEAKVTVTAQIGGAKVTFTITVSSAIRLKDISSKPLSGVVGDTLAPEITFDPSDATDKSYKLKSLDTGVVGLAGTSGPNSLKLVARGAGSGKVEITATDGALKDTFLVSIAHPTIRLKDIGSKDLSGLVGDTLEPQITFDPAEAADKSFQLKSLDTNIAAIRNLKVLAKAEGKTKVEVTATDGGLKDTFEVTVSKSPIKVKTVDGLGLRALPGDTLVADLVFDPADATDQDFTLKSLDTEVAVILSNQKLVAVKLGTAAIEVTTHDGGHKDTFDLVVARAAFKPDVLPITTLKCNPCHIPGQIFNFQDSLVLLRKGVQALDRLKRNPDAPGKMPLKGAPNGDLSPRQLGVILDWLERNVVPLTGMTSKDMVVNLGDTVAPDLTFAPPNASNQTFTLNSLDSAVVAITADNRLLPMKVGQVTVLAKSDEGAINAQIKVTVDPPSFQKNILPITTLKCAPCHVPGQTFNFQDSALLILEGTQALDRLQRDSLAAGKMPLRGAPAGDLTPLQKSILLAWLNAKVVSLKGITVADDSVLVGRKKAPSITFDPANASNKSYLLASADTNIVGIDGGEFEGRTPGTANVEVRAMDGNHVKIISVKVKPVPVDSIQVPEDAGAIGDTLVPAVGYFPADAAVQTYALSLPNASTIVSLVPGNQKVVGLAVGKDTITVTSTDGGKTAQFIVTVGPVLAKGLTVRDTNNVIGVQVTPTVVWNPVNTTNKGITYTIASADTNIAAVRQAGLIQQILGKAVGAVTVTGRSTADTSLKDTFIFTVGPVPVVSLSVPASVQRCSTTISPSSIIVWSPSNATNKGFTLSFVPATTKMQLVGGTSVKALKLGITPVTVTSTDGAKTAIWNVNVIRTDFTGAVKNMFASKCIGCHSPTAWPTRNWQDSTQVVAFRSTIVTRITAIDVTRMPPAPNAALTAAEIKVLRDWLIVE